MPNTTRILITALIVTSLGSNLAAQAAPAASAKPTIVLVHGAFADGSSWQRVIPILQRDGYNVIAVQNPLTSLAADVETTKRVVDAQTGPVVLVGHSYGGAVITAAAAGSSNVKSLVFAATQKPIIGSVFGAAPDQAAWKTIPSWYLVSQDDKAINPDLERFYAKRMNARTTEIKSSHVPFISHPADVARLIEQAASAVK